MCIVCNLSVRIIDDLGGRCARRKYVLWPKRTKKDDFLSFTCYMYMYITCDFVDFLLFTRRDLTSANQSFSIVTFAHDAVCPSVCLSVCPSVRQSVPYYLSICIYLPTFLSSFFVFFPFSFLQILSRIFF